jgi:hypothetical protein
MLSMTARAVLILFAALLPIIGEVPDTTQLKFVGAEITHVLHDNIFVLPTLKIIETI